MEYRESDSTVLLTVREVVTFSHLHYLGAAAGEGALPTVPADPTDRAALGLAEPTPLSLEFVSGNYRFLMTGEASLVHHDRDEVLMLGYLVDGDPAVVDPAVLRAARAEGHLLACARLVECRRAPYLAFCFYCRESGEVNIVRESVTPARLRAGLERVSGSLALHAAAELDRVSRRLPAMRALPFPYRERRLGQEELMESVYRAVARGERLFASAPTGIGKTVSTLYPAVRAMGAGRCDKIFYLTAKATAARMAGETAELLGKDGALRAVLLASKERICQRRGAPCREGRPCENTKGGTKEDRAMDDLLALHRPLIGPDEILEAATRHGVCPHELSLRYSMLSDIVICDYNYLFDPAVRLVRYFALGGRWCFLIDEAHNLPDRIRDTYTAKLSLGEVDALPLPEDGAAPFATETRRAKEALTDYFTKKLYPLVARKGEEDGGVRRSLPDGLVPALRTFAAPLGRLVREGRELPREARTQIRSFYYELKTILDILEVYDEGFRLRVYIEEDGTVAFRTLCLDPAGVVSRCLGDGKSAILFSATLSPIEYYRDVLGGDGNSPTLELPSPFERDNLGVAVLDKVSTRYNDREETLSDVAAAVITTARARRGNYMVFCPSFVYASALADRVGAMAPELRLLRQERTMTATARAAFLAEFERPEAPVLAFCVLGGIWGEGVDLAGRRLIGAVIVGVGLGTPDPLREEIARYYHEKYESGNEYAYLYPGMNRVLQAAGRVIRTEGDVGVVVLIDDRYATPFYRELLPPHWRGLTYAGNTKSLRELLRRFWENHPLDE